MNTASPPSFSTCHGVHALVASALGYAMDGFDLLILGFMLLVIAADLHLTPAQAGSLVTWTLIAAVAGGVVFGVLSDYLGRVRMLTWTILLFAVFTGSCTLSKGYGDLLVYRTIAGVGLGGEFGIGMALVAEAWPARMCARVSSYVGISWQLGVLAAALLTPLLLPVIGWRGMFAVGLAPTVVSFFVRRRVAEPTLFTERCALAAITKESPPKFPAQAPVRRRPHGAREHWRDRAVLGAELRLLRPDDLAAELSVEDLRLFADEVRTLDRRDRARHGGGHLCSAWRRTASGASPRSSRIKSAGSR